MAVAKPAPVEIEIELKSLDPNVPVAKAAAGLKRYSGVLQAAVEAKYPGARIIARRKEGFPAVPDVLAVIFEFVRQPEVVSGIKSGAVAYFVREALAYITERYPDIQATVRRRVGLARPRPAAAKSPAKSKKPAKPKGNNRRK